MCEAKLMHCKEDDKMREELALHRMLIDDLQEKKEKIKFYKEATYNAQQIEKEKLLNTQKMYLALISH
jgi:hypothetical protein